MAERAAREEKLLKAFCDENGIPCTLINYPNEGHNFVVWKYGLYNFAQLIFK